MSALGLDIHLDICCLCIGSALSAGFFLACLVISL